MYTTVVTEHDVDHRAVAYACCRDDNPDMPPCGFRGKTAIFDGKVKVGWKVDWALRWFALGIDYEMHGKDLADSVVISNRVMKYLGKRPPLTYKYELFLDEYGKKISKKLGNGVSIEEWLQYAPTDVLMYFMYAKPNQAKSMALTLIPKAIDDYRQKLTEYDGQADSPIRLIKARDIDRGELTIPASNLEYALICNLVSSLNASDTDMVMEYLCRYDSDVDRNRDVFEELVRKAIAYNRDVLAARKRKLEIDHRFDASLRRFRDRLAESYRDGKSTPDDLQTLCFDIARDDDLPAGDWFRYLYQVLLSQDRGPRMGSFICLYGVDETTKKIDAYLEQQSDDE
jgi:lysyl-tRNA synthetase class 1